LFYLCAYHAQPVIIPAEENEGLSQKGQPLFLSLPIFVPPFAFLFRQPLRLFYFEKALVIPSTPVLKAASSTIFLGSDNFYKKAPRIFMAKQLTLDTKKNPPLVQTVMTAWKLTSMGLEFRITTS
jgi:hypothetical protein